MNVYGKIFDILIAVMIMLLFPMMYLGKKSDLFVYEVMQERMNELVNQVVTQGKITKNMYDQILMISGNFDEPISIEMEYEEYVYEPRYEETLGSYRFTGDIYEYINLITMTEILNAIQKDGAFIMGNGGYFRLMITICDDDLKLYAGGAIRANLSLWNPICNYSNYICDAQRYLVF